MLESCRRCSARARNSSHHELLVERSGNGQLVSHPLVIVRVGAEQEKNRRRTLDARLEMIADRSLSVLSNIRGLADHDDVGTELLVGGPTLHYFEVRPVLEDEADKHRSCHGGLY